MSCNGCRALRKGCSRSECMLRDSLLWIEEEENPQAQANATLFVAKFYGRATLMSFLSSVSPNQRSALFESLLYEGVGRTINPVSGAVGLLLSGNWKLCQLGVDKVLRSGAAADAPLLGIDQISGFVSTNSRMTHPQSSPAALVSDRPSQESVSSTLGTASRETPHCDNQRKLLTLFF